MKYWWGLPNAGDKADVAPPAQAAQKLNYLLQRKKKRPCAWELETTLKHLLINGVDGTNGNKLLGKTAGKPTTTGNGLE